MGGSGGKGSLILFVVFLVLLGMFQCFGRNHSLIASCCSYWLSICHFFVHVGQEKKLLKCTRQLSLAVKIQGTLDERPF